MRVLTLAVAWMLAAGISVVARTQQPSTAPVPVASGFGKGAYPSSPGIDPAVLISRVTPRYTLKALRAGIEGVLELECVVSNKGLVQDVRVVRAVDSRFGLDAAAKDALKKWLFVPAKLQGRTVASLVTVTLQFRLPSDYAAYPKDVALPVATPSMRGAIGVSAASDESLPNDLVPISTPGLRPPVPTRRIDPDYTSEAMRQRIQGAVKLIVVVRTDGTVGQVRIAESLDPDYGLDGQAVKAARLWRFRPAELEGRPVPVAVTLILTFRLR
jgi:TonB family protein